MPLGRLPNSGWWGNWETETCRHKHRQLTRSASPDGPRAMILSIALTATARNSFSSSVLLAPRSPSHSHCRRGCWLGSLQRSGNLPHILAPASSRATASRQENHVDRSLLGRCLGDARLKTQLDDLRKMCHGLLCVLKVALLQVAPLHNLRAPCSDARRCEKEVVVGRTSRCVR